MLTLNQMKIHDFSPHICINTPLVLILRLRRVNCSTAKQLLITFSIVPICQMKD